MKNVLLSACAGIVLAIGASAVSADDHRRYDNGYYDNRDNVYYGNGYYGNGYANDYYDNRDYGYYNNQGNGYANRYYDNRDYGYYDNQDNGYYDNGPQYQNQDYSNGNTYGNGGYGYSHDIVSPRWIVQNLQRQGFSYISAPALAGKFYQVKARDPNGHTVKLYIDAYSGRIVKVKS